MIRKPIILIMTSRDETGNESKRLKDAIQAIGTHNVVIVSDEKYGSVKKVSSMDKLMDAGQEYTYIFETKDKGVAKDLIKIKKFSKRVTRIVNLLKRYRPEYILCVTPYAHHSAIEAKRKAKLHIPIIYILNTFTLPKASFDEYTNVTIVENSDIKQDLIRIGIRSKDIMTLGLPFDIKKINRDKVEFLKNELGLPKKQTILLNFNNKKIMNEIFDLMLDQGGIVNLAVYCEDNRVKEELERKAKKLEDMTVLFVKNEELLDLYQSVSDLTITQYDPSIIYKGFKLGVPSVVLDGGEQSKKDIQYLMNKRLLLRAKEPIEVVGLMYRMLHTEEGMEIAKTGEKWAEASSINNIAQFLASYIVI